mmetsp:Transcript_71380/g.220417  ORF Transcript_71380/g.220417 Transcript_71380/m.220417 type:complete len:377 (-) Transcript_71380:177-1307(-)
MDEHVVGSEVRHVRHHQLVVCVGVDLPGFVHLELDLVAICIQEGNGIVLPYSEAVKHSAVAVTSGVMRLQHDVDLPARERDIGSTQHLEGVLLREFVLVEAPVVRRLRREQAVREVRIRRGDSKPRMGVCPWLLRPLRTSRKTLPSSTPGPERDSAPALGPAAEALHAEGVATPGARAHCEDLAPLTLGIVHDVEASAHRSLPPLRSFGILKVIGEERTALSYLCCDLCLPLRVGCPPRLVCLCLRGSLGALQCWQILQQRLQLLLPGGPRGLGFLHGCLEHSQALDERGPPALLIGPHYGALSLAVLGAATAHLVAAVATVADAIAHARAVEQPGHGALVPAVKLRTRAACAGSGTRLVGAVSAVAEVVVHAACR